MATGGEGEEEERAAKAAAEAVVGALAEEVRTVALIGRANVGKSTLYNRLLRRREAIVSSVAGTTRDRRAGLAQVGLGAFRVVDTGGLGGEALGALSEQVEAQVRAAVQEADIVLFLLDARSTTVTAEDAHIAKWLRKQGMASKVTVVVNKAEGGGGARMDAVADMLEEAEDLGFGEPIPVSALHGDGMGILASVVVGLTEERAAKLATAAAEVGSPSSAAAAASAEAADDAEPNEESEENKRVLQLAIMGRPNVGKSSLLNALLKDDRVITGPMPGVTRDAIAVDWMYRDQAVKLVDTAGVKRWSKRDRSTPIEDLAHDQSVEVLKRSQIVVIVLDAEALALRRMELRLASTAWDEGRAVVFVANKADLLNNSLHAYEQGVRKQVRHRLPQIQGAPVVACSALTGEGVTHILPAVLRTYRRWTCRADTSTLNLWLRDTLVSAPTTRVSGREVRFKYMTQIKTRPPTFCIFANVSTIPDRTKRFLLSRLQQDLNLTGVPARLVVRKSGGFPEARRRQRGSRSKRGRGSADRVVSVRAEVL